jgi:small-conductance mechanosensitive channel
MPGFNSVLDCCFTRQETDAVQTIYQLIVHIRHDTMRRLPTAMDNQSNQDLRIGYLLKELTEEEFKIQLQKREKEIEKKIEYRQILDTFVMVAQELFRQLVQRQLEVNFLYKQIVELMKMINEQITSINHSYQCKLGYIKIANHKVQEYILTKIR